MIKTIIFDIDGVLIDSFEADRKFYHRLLTTNGYAGPTREEYKALFPLTMVDTIKTLTKSNDEQEIQKIFTIWSDKKKHYPFELINSIPHMKETIQQLSQKYTLSIVTNRRKKNIFQIPQLKEIEQNFQIVIAAEDTTKHKPDPEPLFLMLEKMGITADEAVYIWDATSDLSAAQAAGIRFVLLPKREMEGVKYAVENFEDLPEMINTLDE